MINESFKFQVEDVQEKLAVFLSLRDYDIMALKIKSLEYNCYVYDFCNNPYDVRSGWPPGIFTLPLQKSVDTAGLEPSFQCWSAPIDSHFIYLRNMTLHALHNQDILYEEQHWQKLKSVSAGIG